MFHSFLLSNFIFKNPISHHNQYIVIHKKKMSNQLRWWAAVEAHSKKDLTELMFIAIKSISEPDINELSSLIRQGADIEATDAYGRTPLELATEMKRYNVVKLIGKWQKPRSK